MRELIIKIRLKVLNKELKRITEPQYIKKILGISHQKFIQEKCFESKETENLLKIFIKTFF